MFPYTDQQAQRFMQVYRDLKCECPRVTRIVTIRISLNNAVFFS